MGEYPIRISYPEHRMFSSIPGHGISRTACHQPPPPPTLPAVTTKISSDVAKCPLGRQIASTWDPMASYAYYILFLIYLVCTGFTRLVIKQFSISIIGNLKSSMWFSISSWFDPCLLSKVLDNYCTTNQLNLPNIALFTCVYALHTHTHSSTHFYSCVFEPTIHSHEAFNSILTGFSYP